MWIAQAALGLQADILEKHVYFVNPGKCQNREPFANIVLYSSINHDVNRQMTSTVIRVFHYHIASIKTSLWSCTPPILIPPLSPIDHFSFPSGLLCSKDHRMA